MIDPFGAQHNSQPSSVAFEGVKQPETHHFPWGNFNITKRAAADYGVMPLTLSVMQRTQNEILEASADGGLPTSIWLFSRTQQQRKNSRADLIGGFGQGNFRAQLPVGAMVIGLALHVPIERASTDGLSMDASLADLIIEENLQKQEAFAQTLKYLVSGSAKASQTYIDQRVKKNRRQTTGLRDVPFMIAGAGVGMVANRFRNRRRETIAEDIYRIFSPMQQDQ